MVPEKTIDDVAHALHKAMMLSDRKPKLPVPVLPNLQGGDHTKVRYYATSELAWRVGGQVTVVILHHGKSQDVTIVSGDLLAGGYQGTLHAQGEADDSQEAGLDLTKWEDRFLEPVSRHTAAWFIWGLFAFSLRQHTLDPEDFPDGPALGMVPPPRGKAFDWQRSLLKSLDGQCIEIAKEACDEIDLEPPPAEREAWPVVTLATYPNAPNDVLAVLESSDGEFVAKSQPTDVYERGFSWNDPKSNASDLTAVYVSKGKVVTMAPDPISAMAITTRLKALAPKLSTSPAVRWIPHDDIYARQTSHSKILQGLPAGDPYRALSS